MTVLATAPGKVVLLGEYSVLEGSPALAIASDSVARVVVSARTAGECTVSSLPMNSDPMNFEPLADATIRWAGKSGASSYKLLNSVAEFLCKRGLLDLQTAPPFDIRLDSSQLFHQDGDKNLVKVGLGSSAALTVALAYALHAYAGRERLSQQQWLPILVEGHRRFQGDRGSGVDIATSLHGGAVEYSMAENQPRAKRVSLPSELLFAFVWSGRAASTPDLLGRLRSWQHQNRSDYLRAMRDLGDLSYSGLEAVKQGNCAVFLESARKFSDVLFKFGARAGLDILSSGHADLLAMAKKTSLVYKPCGAGSGDLGVAMGSDADAIIRFVSRVNKSEYRIVNIKVNPDGVRVSRS